MGEVGVSSRGMETPLSSLSPSTAAIFNPMTLTFFVDVLGQTLFMKYFYKYCLEHPHKL